MGDDVVNQGDRDERRDRERLVQALNEAARRFGNQVTLYSQAVAAHVGLHPADLDCLSVIEIEGPITAGRLAEVTGLTSGAITGVIDRLERGGYVRREPDPDDRRRVVVRGVPEAMREVGAAFAPMLRATDQVNARYGDDELAIITDWLVRSTPMLREETLRLRDGRSAARATSGDDAPKSAAVGEAGRVAATLRITHGARRLTVVARPDQPQLFAARWWGSNPTVRHDGDTVTVQYRRSPFGHFRTRGEVVLDAAPCWSIELQGGITHSELDLRSTKVDRVSISGGMSTVDIHLPAPDTTQVVEMIGGARVVTITRPPGVPARVVVNGGASNLVLDDRRIGSAGGRTELQTDGYETAHARLEVRLRGGSSSLSIVTRPE